MKFATLYNITDEWSNQFGTVNDDPTMTEQHHAEEGSLAIMMEKYQTADSLPKILQQPMFGDFTHMPTLAEATMAIAQANEAFMSVPAKIRAEFDNDPGKFIEYATNPANKERLGQLGLLKPVEEPTVAEKTLDAIQALRNDLKPKDDDNGSTRTTGDTDGHRSNRRRSRDQSDT